MHSKPRQTLVSLMLLTWVILDDRLAVGEAIIVLTPTVGIHPSDIAAGLLAAHALCRIWWTESRLG